MIYLWHDPYLNLDRFPLGAVPAGSAVRLRLRVTGESERAFVRLWRGGGEEWVPMRALSDSAYEADVPVGREKGLLWYYFVVDTPDGRVYAGKPEDDVCACYDHEPPSFQITVYDPAFEAPEWMRDSVMMQIMVDRFFIGGKANPPAGRGAYLHKSWNELPDLRPAAADGDAEAIDFFGGNLEGVREKLSYLKDLGIGAIYLNPVFRARSNHKYDVGDYLEIDPSFGTEADFERLTREAADAGIHVVLDGVFSHTGADSRYFNRYGTYPSVGAYQSPDSPYAKWYRIDPRTGKYDSWWGIDTLPNVNETEPSFLNFIVNGDDSVIAHYLRSGASGWRLDVADELPMEFIHALRLRAKAEGAQNCVIGEVWEDPTNKVSYGRPRSYALGDTLDSAMNYPLRDTVLAFFLGRRDAYHLANAVNHQLSTLPKPMLYSMMNLLGSHDKPRAINVLAGSQNLEPPREQRAFTPLTPEQYALGSERFVRAFELITLLPGMPCLYYGDEAGLTGMGDPFCRLPYPWGREDRALQARIQSLIRRRNASPILRRGDTTLRALTPDALQITRTLDGASESFTITRTI